MGLIEKFYFIFVTFVFHFSDCFEMIWQLKTYKLFFLASLEFEGLYDTKLAIFI